MANGAIQVPYGVTGRAVYALVRNAAGDIWNGSAFETYAAGNYATYPVTTAEQGANGYYVGDMPAVAAGVYEIAAYDRQGGSPAQTDPLVAAGEEQWDGTALLPLSTATARVTTALPNAAPGGSGGLPMADADNAVLVQAGTGTGQLDFASGVVKANVTQFGGSAGSFGSGKPAVTVASTDVTGNVAADVQTVKTHAVTCSAGVTVAPFVGTATAALVVDAAGHVTLADGVAHGGGTATLELGSSTGYALYVHSSAPFYAGAMFRGGATGAGICAVGGAGWHGIQAVGSAAAGGESAGHGILAVGGAADTGAGEAAGHGLYLQGGTGADLTNGAGDGVYAAGGTAGAAGGGHGATVTHTGSVADVAAVLVAANFGASSLDGKGDWVTTATFPANFSALAITGGGGVTVATNGDKTGYSLTSAYDAATTAAQAGDAMTLTGAAVAAVADGVWDEATSGHTTAGTFGKAVVDAASAGDPWATALPGAYSSGTAGYLVGTNLNATVSSRLATAGYTAPPSVADIADGVWDEAQSGHTTAGTFGYYLDARVSQIPTTNPSAATIASTVWGSGTRSLTTLAGLTVDTVTTVTNRVTADTDQWGGVAVGSAVVRANLVQLLGTAPTETASGRVAAAFTTLFDVASPVLTAASVNQTGDSYARIGATGSGLTSLAPASTALSTAVWTGTRAGYLDNLSGGAVALAAGVTVTTNNDKTGYTLSSAGIAAVANGLLDLADAVESDLTLRQALRAYAAALLGDVTDTGTVYHAALNSGTTRLTVGPGADIADRTVTANL